jgi:hypothetical protein
LSCAIFTEEPENELMAHLSPFTAYFDASGHPSDQPFVVVAGYVANYAQWGLFNRAWEHFHGKAGIELPFHMADFEARARTDYKKWPKNDPEAQDFLLNLCTAQQSYTLLHVACIVDMGQYKDINDVLCCKPCFRHMLWVRACAFR